MAQSPNILFLFTDMQRADTIGALGNPHIRTPNLDRLCHEGTAFTRAYTPSPVCVPARACLHYGKYPQHTGLYKNGVMPEDDGTSYVQRLGEAGYRTHCVGKCHFTPDHYEMRGFQSRQFQEEVVPDPSRDDYLKALFAQGYDHITDPHGVRGEMYYTPQVAQMPAKLHPTQWVGDQSCEYIAQCANEKQPWYLTASFIHPHPPFAPPAPWHKLYRLTDVPMPNVPADFESHWTWDNRVQNRYKYRDQGFDLNLVRMIRSYYYACISFVDFQVGRILNQLEQAGELDNTLIVFSSDHGEYLGDYHCFGKRAMHDASSNVPMLVRWPKQFQAGQVCNRPVSLIDLAPTFCDAGGVRCDDYDGLPLGDVVQGTPRDYVFAQHGEAEAAQYMIVDDRYKYFYSAADNEHYLYDHQNDPHETRRLPIKPWHQAVFTRLRDALLHYLKETGVTKAYVQCDDGQLDWRIYEPKPTMPRNPDDGLLIQDHPWADQHIPGYSENRN